MAKHFFITFVLLYVSFLVVGETHAQLNSNTPEKLSELSLTPSQTRPNTPAQGAIDRSANLQTRAIHEIDRRITSLTNVLNRVNSFERLPDETKTVLTTQIQQEIDDLTVLKSQLEEATDQTVIVELAQDVVTSYRIYAVFLPKIRTILAAEAIQLISDKMLDLHERLATTVSELELEGVDTQGMQQTLIDVEESVTEAENQALSSIELVTPLAPEDFPSNKSIFQTARQSLRSARLSLVSARDSLRALVDEVRAAQSSEDTMGDAMENDTEMTEEITNGNPDPSASTNTFNVQTTN